MTKTSPIPLIHSCLELSHGDLVLLDDVDRSSPAGDGIAIEGVQHRLRNGLEEIVGFEVFAPQGLAHAVELLLAGSDDAKVDGRRDAADEIHGADEGLEGLGIEAGDDGFNEVGTEAVLVEELRHHRGVALRLHCSVLADLVEILAEFQALEDGEDVGLEAGQAQIHVLAHWKYFLEVCCDCLRLEGEFMLR